jgi:hypothetical protein
MLREFFQSSYEAAAEAGDWNRAELEQDYPDHGRRAARPAPPFPRQE